ncbi:hypothetical protein MAPG_04190 [Magnaporthiopsis poae ATCC 64411]|uniref:NADP-dependent oxidoreductase domain-containing protein n=1 Tax=Magnaporthiopsis poae (strain ATCC 64411 / 73-15) TaxID=644358 RepID=A0A0C4DW22_MAGP6|nr:hypothetical protein MAPG_04190 [Magnaporthiopsis poae ATCC 64411]
MAPPAKIPTRRLGKNGPEVAAIGFGLMGLSWGYGAVGSDEERLKVLDRAWEIGATNWDSANIYGDSEDLIGKWFKLHPERRADIFLATKFAGRVTESGFTVDSSPEHCRDAIKTSLERLGVDHVDLYYVHRLTKEVPIEKTVEAMAELVKEGKVRHLGLSECSSSSLRRAHAVHPIAAVQEMARAKGCTAAQLTLAWLLAQGDDIIPIPGTKRIKLLEENTAAVHVKLSPEEVKRFRDEVEKANIQGTRSLPSTEAMEYADTVEL